MLDTHTEQWSLYEKAMKHLERENIAPEFHKTATHPSEVETMEAVNKSVTRVTATIPYREGQFEMIFCNGLRHKGYAVSDDDTLEINI